MGWRWHKWIAVIFTAINFVAVVLFVPETRFDRTSVVASDASTPISASDDAVDIEKSTPATMKVVRQPSDEAVPQVPKKTFVQDLSLWSGTPSTNVFKMFLRYNSLSTND